MQNADFRSVIVLLYSAAELPSTIGPSQPSPGTLRLVLGPTVATLSAIVDPNNPCPAAGPLLASRP